MIANEEKERLKHEAAVLAEQPYSVAYDIDTLPDGTEVVTAYHPELPGCMADGDSVEEAKRNLASVRSFHIYLLLSRSVEVPEPRRPSSPADELWRNTVATQSNSIFIPEQVATSRATRGLSTVLVISR